MSNDTFGIYPCAAIRGDGGMFGEPMVIIEDEGFAELYIEDGVPKPGVGDIRLVDGGGGDSGIDPMGGDSGDVEGPWLGVLGRDEECFIAERSGGGRGR